MRWTCLLRSDLISSLWRSRWEQLLPPDYFKGIKSFTKVVPDLPWGSGLIYGGNEVQSRSGVNVYPVWDISKMLELLDGKAG